MINLLRRLKYKLAEIINPPKKTCIVCKQKIYGFLPIPAHYAEMSRKVGRIYTANDAETLNVLEYSCPNCYCSDRDRLYALYFNKNFQANRTYKLLDIAPAASLASFLRRFSNIKYRSADLFMDGVDDKVDLTDMKIYDDNSFDIFICSHVLEHVPDDRKAMRELFRVLKPGGWGITMVPILLPVTEIDEDITITDVNERWRRFGQDDHVRQYSKAGFKQRLQEAGFKVKEFGVDYFGKENFALNGINPRSVLYISQK